MIIKILIFCGFIVATCSAKPGRITFKNVNVQGFSSFTLKFNISIASSNELKPHLPKMAFDQIQIINQNVPVLYQNSIKDIDNLDELNIENCGLLEIQPGAFKDLPVFRKLEIKNNQLEEIKQGVFNHLPLNLLDLSSNVISNIDSAAFDNMPELIYVNLYNNKIGYWNSDWFKNTPLISRVALDNNLIEAIPKDAFKMFKGEKNFGKVPLTVNIILSHNKIKSIDKTAFKDVKKINNLWLDNNEIEDWDGNWLKQNEVESLRMNSNKIQCLNGDLGKILVAKTTHLDGNPWDCKCLQNIEEFAKKNGRNVQMFYSKLTCEADRIEQKLRNLESYLKRVKDIEEETEAPA